MADEVNYVILKPNKFIGDCLDQGWTDAEFGCYCKLVFLLYMKGGSLRFDLENFAHICRAGSVQDFEQKWKHIEHKFTKVRGKLKHKTVTKELKKAKERMQTQRKKGVTGAKARWHKQCYSHSTSNANPMPTKTETKSKTKTESEREISPTLQQVIDRGIALGVPKKHSVIWYEHYSAQGFKFSSGVSMTDLRMAMNRHKNNGTLAALVEKAGKRPKTQEEKKESQKQWEKKEIARIREENQDYLESKTTKALEDIKKDGGHLWGLCGWLIDEILAKRRGKKC